MFSRNLESTLNEAFVIARERRHEFITIEHLLMNLLDNPEVEAVLVTCGANLDRLRAGLRIFIDETTPVIPPHVERDIQPTLSFQRVLQRAIYQVQSTGRPEVTGTNVLAAIFGEPDSQAVYFLNQENVTRIDIINYLSQGVSKYYRPDQFQLDESPSAEDVPLTREGGGGGEENLIEMYAVNLNERARAGKLDPVIGREKEMERVIQILCRRTKNNPLFIGEAGVGKTAIAEGLAQMIIAEQVPKTLAYTIVYSVDLATMLAGTKYRGDFEKRFKAVLKALSRRSGAIVFIDEVHNLIGAGSATGGTMDAANLIKPMLSRGELRCMGATTYEEYRNFIAKDHALLRRFQKVDIEEPSFDHTLQILHGLKSRFESHHNITYSDESLLRAVELSSRYLPDRHLPDKAIDLIDEAGAYQHLLTEAKRRKVIRVKDIERVMSKIARIPIEHVSSPDKQLLKQLPVKLKQRVYGQDQAIVQLSDAIKLSRAGLRDPNKPVGSFLFAGPTGVGKTELTKQLANLMGVELLRFDMSEYMEKHAVSRLIGAPPGYVGFDQGGLFTEAIIKQPHAVLLLDEIEKAHPDLFNILLQVMDYGMLTDNNGRKADFRHVIIVMTTNAGAETMERNAVGFNDNTGIGEDSLEAVKKIFSPEFRNRLDSVVQFNPLGTEVIAKIVDKCVKELQEKLAGKSVKLSLTAGARKWLMQKGYDRKMGARPMERVVEKYLKKPLADEILFGCITQSGIEAQVCVTNNELQIKYLREVKV